MYQIIHKFCLKSNYEIQSPWYKAVFLFIINMIMYHSKQVILTHEQPTGLKNNILQMSLDKV